MTCQGDPDLYLKYDSLPNKTSWDYRDATVNDYVVLEVSAPAHGYWYIGVYGYNSYDASYVLTATASSTFFYFNFLYTVQ